MDCSKRKIFEGCCEVTSIHFRVWFGFIRAMDLLQENSGQFTSDNLGLNSSQENTDQLPCSSRVRRIFRHTGLFPITPPPYRRLTPFNSKQ